MTTLYKTNKNNSIQQWSIAVDGPVFTCTYGQLEGKLQSQSTTCTPRNIGRSNETTPEQQAQLEADALIAKKLKSGYSYDQSGPTTVKLPMKIKSYQDQISNVKFPCISTPKLNGVNAIFKRVDGVITIYSRGGEVYPPIPHLEQLVHKSMDLFKSNELNGELYIHGEHLQDIQSAVKKPKALSYKLSFCIFDIADSKDLFSARAAVMNTISNFRIDSHPAVWTVANYICNSHEDIEHHYNQCMAANLEGTVIKNFDGLYQHNVRSSDQFKYKKVQSKEFLITSFELDKNNLPVFVLKCDTGTFKAKPKGTKEYWSKFNPSEYINHWATVEFETYSRDKIPLKPIFISLRDCTTDGTPLE